MAVKKSKIQQAESRLVLRSQIKLAEYNPRRISEDARKALKANLKRLGLMGGIIWNDPDIGIVWPGVVSDGSDGGEYRLADGTPLILSEKDRHWPGIREAFGA